MQKFFVRPVVLAMESAILTWANGYVTRVTVESAAKPKIVLEAAVGQVMGIVTK
jgi:hypothetical protein